MVNIDKGVVIYKAPSVPQFQLNKPYNPYPLIPTGGGTVIIGGNGEVYSQKEMDIVLERLYKDNEEV